MNRQWLGSHISDQSWWCILVVPRARDRQIWEGRVVFSSQHIIQGNNPPGTKLAVDFLDENWVIISALMLHPVEGC